MNKYIFGFSILVTFCSTIQWDNKQLSIGFNTVQAGSGECNFIKNDDLKNYCKRDCNFIKNDDLKNFCKSDYNFIKNSDLKNYGKSDCNFIKDNDLKQMCKAGSRYPGRY